MRVALVQVASPPDESVAARRDRVAAMVEDAAGADLVVLPELWAPGYFAFDSYAERAEPLHGDTVAAARQWSHALGCYLHAGSFIERTADGLLHNTAVLLDPSGAIVHVYRKVHVFGYQSREAQLLTPGREVPVASTALGRIGATTCYDLRFPELWRALVDADARCVITPAAWPMRRLDHWKLFTQCRAVEEQIVLIACNAVGEQDGGVLLAGHSRVVGPWGDLIAEAGETESVTFADVDMDVVWQVRAEFPVLADRRIAITS